MTDDQLIPLLRQKAWRIRSNILLQALRIGPAEREEIRHRPVGAPSTTAGLEDVTRDWLPRTGEMSIGLTAGASTPNNIVGQVIEKLERFASPD